MARTADDLIKKAFIKLGISFQTPLTSGQSTDGLDAFNLCLDQFASNPSLISYYSILSFPLVIGQESYTISTDTTLSPDVNHARIVEPKYVILVDSNNLQSQVDITTDFPAYENNRNLNSQGQPRGVYFQNEPQLTNMIFYQKPEQAYTCKVKAKFVLEHVDKYSDITTLPPKQDQFFIYHIGRHLSTDYSGANWTAEHENIYNDLRKAIVSTSDMNLKAKTGVSLLGNGGYCNIYNC